MVKISDLLIGLIIVGVVGTSIFLFIGGLGQEYGVSVDSSNEQFYRDTILNSTIQAQQIQNKLSNTSADTTIADRLGAFFGSGYDALVLSANSLNIFGSLTNQASEDLGVPAYIKGAIIAILIVIVFVAIILSSLLKVQQ